MKRWVPLLLAALACTSLAACGGDDGGGSGASATAETGTSAAGTGTSAAADTEHGDHDHGSGVTLDQCTGEKLDRQVTYDEVPEKIFTLDPQSAEFLIALGLGDRIVATWGMYSDDDLAFVPQYAEELKKIKRIGDDETWPPPVEQIAATEPDIVVTTYRLNIPNYLDANRLEKEFGIKAYSFTSYCNEQVMKDFAPLFNDITNLGKIFDVSGKADDLIVDMQADLDEAASFMKGKPRYKVWQYAGEDPPYPVGGTGIPNAIMTLAGADNVFEDVEAVYAEVSWEQVVSRNPQVIWLQTAAGPGFIETEGALLKATTSNPGLAGVEGVAKKRFVVIPYTTAGTLSVHNAEAVLQFAEELQKVGAAS